MDMPQLDCSHEEVRLPTTFKTTALDSTLGRYVYSAKAVLESDPASARALLDRLGALLSNADATGQDDPYLPESATVEFVHRGGLAKWQWRKLHRFIEESLVETILVGTLAGLVQLSSGYFSRAFKVCTGDTPHTYITRQRIRRAQILMLTTDEPLSEIALMCGFADQAHMTRKFARHVSQTPFVWRRNFKAG